MVHTEERLQITVKTRRFRQVNLVPKVSLLCLYCPLSLRKFSQRQWRQRRETLGTRLEVSGPNWRVGAPVTSAELLSQKLLSKGRVQ